MSPPERLPVPSLMAEGRWTHAFIVTYNADLRFYESDIWPSLTARNCVVLMDDGQLPQAVAEAGRLRHANVRYVLERVTGSVSAHAKLVWLSNADEGVLMVGSGNLTTNGYARAGELFTRYRQSDSEQADVGAFQDARRFLDALVDRGHVSQHVRPHLQRAWAEAPWLHQPSPGPGPLRDNLDVPLLDQLVQQVGGRTVDSLVVHAPFYDPRCDALRRCLETLAPGQVEVLLQDGETSVDPKALSRVLDRSGTIWSVRAAQGPSASTYLHAKFVLARLENTDVCLQGSANLSLAAMTRVPPAGNIELANLLEGPKGTFEHLVTGLSVEATSLSELRLALRQDTDPSEDTDAIRLLSGRLTGSLLRLDLSDAIPTGSSVRLLVGDAEVAEAVVDGQGPELRVTLPDEVASWFVGRARPVALRLSGPDLEYETNPVYPVQPSELEKLLVGQTDPETLRRIGEVDIGLDDDIAATLADLAEALPLDRAAVWRAIRPRETKSDSAPASSWEDIDWEIVRGHPMLSQYHSLAARRSEPTDLQILLRAAGKGIPNEPEVPGTTLTGSWTPDDEDAEDLSPRPDDRDPVREEERLTDEEVAARDARREQRYQDVQKRNRRAWLSFFKRLVLGLEDAEFVEVVGRITAVTNGVLADRLLTLLVIRGHLEVEDVIDFQLRLWDVMWSDSGLVAGVGGEEAELVSDVLEDHAALPHTIGGIFLAERETRFGGWMEERIRMRERWRSLLHRDGVTADLEAVLEAARLAESDPAVMAEALADLAWETYEDEVAPAVAAALGVPLHAVAWASAVVSVGGKAREVQQLVVDSDIELDTDIAFHLLTAWHRVDPHREYWRCQTRVGPVVRDDTTQDAWWHDRAADHTFDIEGLSAELAEGWVQALDEACQPLLEAEAG